MAQFTMHDSSFKQERDKVESISSVVGPNLAKIEEIVMGMSNYWQDDKSAGFITDVTSSLSSAKTKYQSLLSDVDNLYSAMEPLFNIYS